LGKGLNTPQEAKGSHTVNIQEICQAKADQQGSRCEQGNGNDETWVFGVTDLATAAPNGVDEEEGRVCK
jgi:hypothetical protein